MDDLDKKIIAAINLALDERAGVSPEIRIKHHAWVAAQIARDNKRAEFWKAMAHKSFPGMLWALTLSAASWTWHFVQRHWQ